MKNLAKNLKNRSYFLKQFTTFRFSNKIERPNDIEIETENADPIEVEDKSERNLVKVAKVDVKNVNIRDIYNISSKKLGPPKIRDWIDRSKIDHPGVRLGVFDPAKFNKDEFENKNPIPISPKLGPFEVKLK